MSNPVSPNCPQCGAALPANAPGGLCPQCLMALNLKTETVFTGDNPAVQPPLPPERFAPHFPQLEILECLGRGGMGVVYKARQKTLNRLVALKLLAPERVHDAKFAARFTREAQALATLHHPNIVTIYDFGQAGGFYYLLMELVDGLNLRKLLDTHKFTPEEALAIVPPLCDALQFAHDRGVVHRDIKPENLLLDKGGRVMVADFGIAKMLGTTNHDHPGESAAPENATQAALGTPGYSAPEQKTHPQRVDNRADIYSLGVVIYEMLTGELPGKRIEPPSRKVQIDVRLDEVVLRALETKPERRYQQASALKTQVETIASSAKTAAMASPVGKSQMVRMVEAAFNLTFTSPRAVRLINLSALGFLAFVAFLGFVPLPGMHYFFGCSGFAGLFGLIGIAQIVEFAARRKAGTPPVPRPPQSGLKRWLRKICLLQLPAALIIALIIRTYFLQAFWAATDAAAPELPRGSHFLVWKITHFFAPGDLIAYRHDGWVSVGRVDHTVDGSVYVKRNGEVPILVARAAILGRIISIYWRAPYTAPAAPPASAETWQPELAPGVKPDLEKISNEVKTLTEQTNYEASLQHQVWYFNHALENGADASVRNTFGIMNWSELAREYPKARQALVEIRDQDQEKFKQARSYSSWASETTNSLPAILRGDMRSRFNLFQEMSALNLTLNDDAGRQALVKMLVTTDPALARDMGYKVHEDAFDAFSKKADNAGPDDDIGNGQAAFDAIHHHWEGLRQSHVHMSHVLEEAQRRMTEDNARRGMPPPVMPFDSHNPADDIFLGNTRQLIKTLVAHGHQADAEKIQDEAVALLDDPWLKTAVTDAESELKNQSGSTGNP